MPIITITFNGMQIARSVESTQKLARLTSEAVLKLPVHCLVKLEHSINIDSIE